MSGDITRRTTVKSALAAAGTLTLGTPALAYAARRAAADPGDAWRLWYDKPAADRERESLPLGNGALGVGVFGTLASERLTLNEKTLWTGGPGSGGGYDFGNWRRPAPRRRTGRRRGGGPDVHLRLTRPECRPDPRCSPGAVGAHPCVRAGAGGRAGSGATSRSAGR
ncbi:glycoside hydrolase family 95 protein [Streptomyces sp. NBC_01808]|uniref:glycoside hydrolase N-terminal domain-containing protein n=1 Tax=Streptomyces sp. NBC_01808 TaxID=2975947 RepID=UPI002DDC1C9E|nr:glycoside hydrolase N-terminal domain-containing protein [Streptomyces sp. NBC_01808]WSA39550.1 glycoside hydrolase family 95 protein [Streptomyces sp. NBC_01808]